MEFVKDVPLCKNLFWGGECKVKATARSRILTIVGNAVIFYPSFSHMGADQGYNPQIKIETLKGWVQN